MMLRAALGLGLAACIAFLARRTRSLSTGGAVAATLVGGAAVAAGWSWGALLIIYFASSSILSHVGRGEKERRTGSIVAKSGDRDAVQVLANGAIFAGAALAMVVRPDVHWLVLGAGALAASAADTWATEVGTLRGGEPHSILTGRSVPAGTSGGVSMIGTIGLVSGAAFIGAAMIAVGWNPYIARYVFIGGIVGAVVDSLLGATMQARRWCEPCGRETERAVHDCGAATRAHRGLGWLDNDIVNFLSTAAGGLLAALLTR
jgi:uncharacterized protein (TIGR00297 family)